MKIFAIRISGIFALVLLNGVLFAQAPKLLTGAALVAGENAPVRMASITNITLGKTTISRGNGTFELQGAPGHIIAWSANGFYADTLVITPQQFEAASLLLTLRPLPSTLTGVTVVGNYSAYQIDSMERRKSFLQNVGERKTPTVSRSTDMGFGVGINLDRWSKKEKQERRARTIFDIMEEEAYINFRWNETIVARYTGLAGDELLDFMYRNRPEYLWLRRHTSEEDLLYYINTALKKDKRKKH